MVTYGLYLDFTVADVAISECCVIVWHLYLVCGFLSLFQAHVACLNLLLTNFRSGRVKWDLRFMWEMNIRMRSPFVLGLPKGFKDLNKIHAEFEEDYFGLY